MAYYIIDYTRNEKYIIQSFSHFNFKSLEEQNARKKNILFNPNINLKMNVEFSPIYDNIRLYEPMSGSFLDKNVFFRRKVNGLFLDVLYKCRNENCSDYYDFIKGIKNNYYLIVEYEGFRLDHQNKNGPIVRQNDEGYITFKKRVFFNFSLTTSMHFSWRNIIYTEKKGFFQNDTKYSCKYIENYEQSFFGYLRSFTLEDKNSYINIISMEFEDNINEYTEYFRKRISELDLLANILSLIANFYTAMKFIFSFYSNNFNNFKIIEKLFFNPTNKNQKIHYSSEIPNLESNKFISLKNDLNEKCINPIINDEDNNDSINSNDIDDNEFVEDKKRIKKMKCFDFFLNNLYCCCKKHKKQKIIHMCNEIVSKYSSVDAIIKNQILIENFMKDYNWNDADLNILKIIIYLFN